MSSSPCKFKDKCNRKDCPYSHELISHRGRINPIICKYGADCRTKSCTFTHLTLPKGATKTRPDCKNNIHCSRVDCFFNHPNGRLIDNNTTFSLNSAQTTNDVIIPALLDSKNDDHKRDDSPYGTASSNTNHSRASSISSNEEINNCRFGKKCKRIDCFFEHPHGRDIDQRSTTIINTDNEQPSEDELIETIDKLFLNAQEQQEESDTSDKDDDDLLDVIQKDALQELKLQKNEFVSTIQRLAIGFDSILASTHNISQLRRIQKQLERELKRWKSCLPIYGKRSIIIEKLRKSQVFILKADTGSGKSTQIPQYLCDEYFTHREQIICTQPRKLAVRSLSARVAEEYGCKIGDEVGFQVGGGRSTTSYKTKIKFVTDTFFLNEYQNDPLLQNYSVVIVDEAHERKIDTDIVFGIMKQCLRKRHDLKLVIMSATLDTNLLYKYFADEFHCNTLEVAGRSHPIEDIYLDEDVENYVQASVTKAIEIHQSDEIGDILVFLTGRDEIDLALTDLNKKLEKDEKYIGLPLHGKLSEEENARIFEKMPDKRKIIFSTNVAETSITIDGIKHVIESGMVKEKMWDEKRKMQVLKIGQITKSSVKQRRGRAGRTSAGKCYHLYTIETYEAMDPCSRAEILCTQPTTAILKLKHLNIDDIQSFEWLEPPSESSLREAYQILIWLNAIDKQDKLTNLGRNMARLDIDPKLAAMLYKGKELNCLSYALILAGMLTVSQNIWWSNKDQKSRDIATQARAQLCHESGDHITLINIYLKWNEFCMNNKLKKQQYDWCKNHSINSKSLQMAQDFLKEKARQMEHEIQINDNEELNDDLIFRLLQCMTAGHFLNLAISNGPLRAGYRVISPFSSLNNQTVITARVFRTSTLYLNDQIPKYILFNELLNLNGTNYVTILSSINLDWLKSVSQQWYTLINGSNLQSISYESYTFEDVGVTLLQAIVGKRHCNLNRLEDMTQAVIDVNYKQAKLIVWSREINLEKAKEILGKTIEKEKEKLLTETEEIHIVGSTRILMGAGGISQMILIGDEFIRIIMTKLPSTITEERIKELCERFGHIHKIDFIRQNEGGSCVAVTYPTIEQARKALATLNGHVEQDREIVVSGSYRKTDAIPGKQTCRLKALWYLTPSNGNGKVIFNQDKSAYDACQLFKRLHFECHYERPTNIPTLKVTYYLGTNNGKAFINFKTPQQAKAAVAKMMQPGTIILARDKDNHERSVLYRFIPQDYDEEDVRTLFQHCDGIADVQVLRGRKGRQFQRPVSAENDLIVLLSHYESFQRDTITFNPKILNGKLEAYMKFLDMTELKEAINEMDGKTGHIGCGKLRLSERVQQKTKQKDEYIVKFRNLDATCDRYDLINILKQNQLYDDVKCVIVYREPLEKSEPVITKTTTVLEEQERGLVHLRSMFLNAKDLFRSVPDCQILSCAPDGTVNVSVMFTDPADVATAIQNFDNRKIHLFPGESKLRLIPLISHEIFINAPLKKAIFDKIQQAIQTIREKFKRVRVKEVPSQKTEKTPTMKIFLQSDDVQQITIAKTELDNLIKGMEYTFEDDPEKIKILFERVGKTTLQQIQNKTGSYIWSNYFNSSVRIYGSDQATVDAKNRIDKYIRDTLQNKKHTVLLDIPSGYVRQVFKKSATYQDTIEKEFNVEINTLVPQRQIRIIGKEEDVTRCEQSIRNEWLAMCMEPQASSKSTIAMTTIECPICCNTANYSLQSCGHAYCLDCLKQHLSTKFDTTLSSKSLEIKCMMPQCDAALLLRDIKTIIDPSNMYKLARASFQAYLKTETDIIQCMGIDCKQVFRKSKHLQSYFCDGCLKMYCVKCEVEYHVGLTCEEYQAFLKLSPDERSAIYNIGKLNLKACPSCKQVIDRYDGCNAVKCKCGISFCWLCLKSDPTDIHYHYADQNSPCFGKTHTRA